MIRTIWSWVWPLLVIGFILFLCKLTGMVVMSLKIDILIVLVVLLYIIGVLGSIKILFDFWPLFDKNEKGKG